MQSNFYVSLSAQLALQKRMDTLAHNIANTNTVGFRSEGVKFESYLSEKSANSVAFASSGETFLSRKSGQIVKTDNPLDVAVKGDAWLGIQTSGGQVYTRDGRMRMTDTGQLETLNGHAVLDVGGAPIQVNPKGGAIRIGRDGMITQNNQQLGAIGLFQIDPNAKLIRAENSGVIPDQPAIPALDFTSFGVEQGYVENANVNPVLEISRLITVSRAFEAVSKSIEASEASLDEAIRTLGSGT